MTSYPYTAVATTKYKPPPGSTDSIAFAKGDKITVRNAEDEDEDWLRGTLESGKEGIFPAYVIERVEMEALEEKGEAAEKEDIAAAGEEGKLPEAAVTEPSKDVDSAVAAEQETPVEPPTPTTEPAPPTPIVPVALVPTVVAIPPAKSTPTPASPPTVAASSPPESIPPTATPPTPKKPGSLRDRIAALNAAGAGATSPQAAQAPPAPRTKPPVFAKKLTPPPAPANAEPASTPTAVETASTDEPREVQRAGERKGAMSAEDAKESIGKGGGSLKERIAALQKLEAVTATPVAVGKAPPKPWKRPAAPAIVEPVEESTAVTTEGEGEEGANVTKSSSAEVDESIAPTSSTTKDLEPLSTSTLPIPSPSVEGVSPLSPSATEPAQQQRGGVTMPALPRKAGPPRRKMAAAALAAVALPAGEVAKLVEPKKETDEETAVEKSKETEEKEVVEVDEARIESKEVEKDEVKNDDDEFDTPDLPESTAAPIPSEPSHKAVQKPEEIEHEEEDEPEPEEAEEEEEESTPAIIEDAPNPIAVPDISSAPSRPRIPTSFTPPVPKPAASIPPTPATESVSKKVEELARETIPTQAVSPTATSRPALPAHFSSTIPMGVPTPPAPAVAPFEEREDEEGEDGEGEDGEGKADGEDKDVAQSAKAEQTEEAAGEEEPQQEEDPEVARRAALAKRMAALGGMNMRMGMMPPVGMRKPALVKRNTSEDSEPKEAESAPAPAPRRVGSVPTGGFLLPGINPRVVPAPEPAQEEATAKLEPEEEEVEESEPREKEDEEDDEAEPAEAAAPPPLPAGRPSGSVPVPSRESLPPALPGGRPPQRAPPAPTVIVAEPSPYDDDDAEGDDESEIDVPIPPRRKSSSTSIAHQASEEPLPPVAPPRPAAGPPPLPSKRDSREVAPSGGFATLTPSSSQRSHDEGGLLGVSIPHYSMEEDEEAGSPTSDFVVVAPPARQDSRSSATGGGSRAPVRSSTGSHPDQQYQYRTSSIGAQIFAAAHSMLRDRSVRITPDAFVNACLARVTEVKPREGYAFGLLVYSVEGDAKAKSAPVPGTELDEPCPGDIVVITSGKFKHNLSTTKVGEKQPHVAVVDTWDAKKHKMKVLEVVPGKEGPVEEGAYRIEDLRGGRVDVYRVQ